MLMILFEAEEKEIIHAMKDKKDPYIRLKTRFN